MKTVENWHGTRSGYNGRACRCDRCREAQRIYQLDLSRKRSDAARAKRNAYMREYYWKNRDQWLETARKWREDNPERVAESYARRNAKQRGNPEYLSRQRDRRYGLAPGQFEMMLKAQGNCCAICQVEFSGVPHVDHDHACCPGQGSCGGCVRGLLCASCNAGIGSLGDDPDCLRNAALYIERHLGGDAK